MATPPNPGSAASNARAGSSLNTPPNARVNTADRPAARGTSAWLGIGIFLFILLLALVFSSWHRALFATGISIASLRPATRPRRPRPAP